MIQHPNPPPRCTPTGVVHSSGEPGPPASTNHHCDLFNIPRSTGVGEPRNPSVAVAEPGKKPPGANYHPTRYPDMQSPCDGTLQSHTCSLLDLADAACSELQAISREADIPVPILDSITPHAVRSAEHNVMRDQTSISENTSSRSELVQLLTVSSKNSAPRQNASCHSGTIENTMKGPTDMPLSIVRPTVIERQQVGKTTQCQRVVPQTSTQHQITSSPPSHHSFSHQQAASSSSTMIDRGTVRQTAPIMSPQFLQTDNHIEAVTPTRRKRASATGPPAAKMRKISVTPVTSHTPCFPTPTPSPTPPKSTRFTFHSNSHNALESGYKSLRSKFRCRKCPVAYASQAEVIEHVNKKHWMNYPGRLLCKECLVVAKRSSQFKKHVLSAHPNTEPYMLIPGKILDNLQKSLIVPPSDGTNNQPTQQTQAGHLNEIPTTQSVVTSCADLPSSHQGMAPQITASHTGPSTQTQLSSTTTTSKISSTVGDRTELTSSYSYGSVSTDHSHYTTTDFTQQPVSAHQPSTPSSEASHNPTVRQVSFSAATNQNVQQSMSVAKATELVNTMMSPMQPTIPPVIVSPIPESPFRYANSQHLLPPVRCASSVHPPTSATHGLASLTSSKASSLRSNSAPVINRSILQPLEETPTPIVIAPELTSDVSSSTKEVNRRRDAIIDNSIRSGKQLYTHPPSSGQPQVHVIEPDTPASTSMCPIQTTGQTTPTSTAVAPPPVTCSQDFALRNSHPGPPDRNPMVTNAAMLQCSTTMQERNEASPNALHPNTMLPYQMRYPWLPSHPHLLQNTSVPLLNNGIRQQFVPPIQNMAMPLPMPWNLPYPPFCPPPISSVLLDFPPRQKYKRHGNKKTNPVTSMSTFPVNVQTSVSDTHPIPNVTHTQTHMSRDSRTSLPEEAGVTCAHVAGPAGATHWTPATSTDVTNGTQMSVPYQHAYSVKTGTTPKVTKRTGARQKQRKASVKQGVKTAATPRTRKGPASVASNNGQMMAESGVIATPNTSDTAVNPTHTLESHLIQSTNPRVMYTRPSSLPAVEHSVPHFDTNIASVITCASNPRGSSVPNTPVCPTYFVPECGEIASRHALGLSSIPRPPVHSSECNTYTARTVGSLKLHFSKTDTGTDRHAEAGSEAIVEDSIDVQGASSDAMDANDDALSKDSGVEFDRRPSSDIEDTINHNEDNRRHRCDNTSSEPSMNVNLDGPHAIELSVDNSTCPSLLHDVLDAQVPTNPVLSQHTQGVTTSISNELVPCSTHADQGTQRSHLNVSGEEGLSESWLLSRSHLPDDDSSSSASLPDIESADDDMVSITAIPDPHEEFREIAKRALVACPTDVQLTDHFTEKYKALSSDDEEGGVSCNDNVKKKSTSKAKKESRLKAPRLKCMPCKSQSDIDSIPDLSCSQKKNRIAKHRTPSICEPNTSHTSVELDTLEQVTSRMEGTSDQIANMAAEIDDLLGLGTNEACTSHINETNLIQHSTKPPPNANSQAWFKAWGCKKKTPAMLECYICSFQSKTKKAMLGHCGRHIRVDPFSCSMCFIQKRTADSIQRHIRTSHRFQDATVHTQENMLVLRDSLCGNLFGHCSERFESDKNECVQLLLGSGFVSFIPHLRYMPSNDDQISGQIDEAIHRLCPSPVNTDVDPNPQNPLRVSSWDVLNDLIEDSSLKVEQNVTSNVDRLDIKDFGKKLLDGMRLILSPTTTKKYQHGDKFLVQETCGHNNNTEKGVLDQLKDIPSSVSAAKSTHVSSARNTQFIPSSLCDDKLLMHPVVVLQKL